MKKIILSATALSGLLLTGCIPLDSSNVGVPFTNYTAQAAAAIDPANLNPVKLSEVTATEGLKFDAGFDPKNAQFYANKSTVADLLGGSVDVRTEVNAIGVGVSRVKNKSDSSKWDRIQNHPITIGMEVKVNLSIDDAKASKFDSAKIDVANLKIQGAFGTSDVATFKNYESDPTGKLKNKKVDDLSSSDFIPTGGVIKAVISDGTLTDYSKNLLTTKEEIKDKELYGAYRNGDQYTAYYAAGLAITDAAQVKDKGTSSKYDVKFRGIANWGGTSYNKLLGDGNLNVNFAAGTYTGDITVKDGGTAIGEIAFSNGTSTNTITFSDDSATYTPTGATAVTGNVSGTAFGNDAATFMGTTDFAENNDVLVGAFNAVAK